MKAMAEGFGGAASAGDSSAEGAAKPKGTACYRTTGPERCGVAGQEVLLKGAMHPSFGTSSHCVFRGKPRRRDHRVFYSNPSSIGRHAIMCTLRIVQAKTAGGGARLLFASGGGRRDGARYGGVPHRRHRARRAT